jgi:hypothetical protein
MKDNPTNNKYLQENKRGTELFLVVSVIFPSLLIHVEVDSKLSLTPLSIHCLILSQVDKETLNTSVLLASPLPLQRGRHEPLTTSSTTSSQPSPRAQ